MDRSLLGKHIDIFIGFVVLLTLGGILCVSQHHTSEISISDIKTTCASTIQPEFWSLLCPHDLNGDDQFCPENAAAMLP